MINWKTNILWVGGLCSHPHKGIVPASHPHKGIAQLRTILMHALDHVGH